MVIPGGSRIGQGDLTAALLSHLPTVKGNMLEQERVLARHLRLKTGLWAQNAQRCLFQEDGVFLFEQQIIHLQVGGQRHRNFDLDDISIHKFLAALARHRDAVVAIFDEIHLAKLIQLHRRQVDLLVMGLVNAHPTPLGARLQRQKGPVKITVAANAANDLVNLNLS